MKQTEFEVKQTTTKRLNTQGVVTFTHFSPCKNKARGIPQVQDQTGLQKWESVSE